MPFKDPEFQSTFRQAQPKFSRLYTRMLSTLDLTLPQYALLNILEADGPMSMTEASRKLHLSKPAVTNLVDRLAESGRVKRCAHTGDRRVIMLRVLSPGLTVVRKMRSQVLNVLMGTLGRFSGSERKVISRFYAALSEGLDGRLGDKG